MKLSRSLIVLFVLSVSCDAMAQDFCVRALKVLSKVNSLHIQPRTVNDSLSAEIFSEFFHVLDPHSQYFISRDTGSLVRYRNRLDDGNDPVCAFVYEAGMLFRRKAEWYRNFTDSLLSRPMDLSKVAFGPPLTVQPAAICKTNAELKQQLITSRKLEVLMSMYRHSSADKELTVPVANALEQAARLRVKRNALVKIERLLKDEKSLAVEVQNSYLKAIPAVFDPHSTYFTKDEMAAFNQSLSPTATSFGIQVEESNTGEVTVSSVVPGGPAWNSNQVNKGDVVVGVKWRESGEYVDLADLDEEFIKNILEQQGEASADLVIKKTTGELRQVRLVKEKIENEENVVSGFVLKSKDSKRSIGYISLPGFFTDENDPELKGCAVAVTKEIIKLKGEAIEGLIVDLRYNGGGSLFEAMELAGLFIDNGPVGVIETRGEAPMSLKDMNRGLVYDGPLVIMVNGASASASELVAGALQDYRRAVIVGSTTYGKATGQDLVPLNENNPDEGFLKVTEMYLYRVNGQSHQLKGVVPDFPIRDLSSVVYYREEQARHAMKPGLTKKKTYYTQWPASSEEVIKYTIENNPTPAAFAGVLALQEILTARTPLERKAFFEFMEKLVASSEAVSKGVDEREVVYTVSNSKYDETFLKVDLYHREMNDEIMSQVRSSLYIHEAYRLLDNIITKKK